MGNFSVCDDLYRAFVGLHQFGCNFVPGMVMQRVVHTGDRFHIGGDGPDVVGDQQDGDVLVEPAQLFVELSLKRLST